MTDPRQLERWAAYNKAVDAYQDSIVARRGVNAARTDLDEAVIALAEVGGPLRPGLNAAAKLLRNIADAKEARSLGGLGIIFADQSAAELRAAADRIEGLVLEVVV